MIGPLQSVAIGPAQLRRLDDLIERLIEVRDILSGDPDLEEEPPDDDDNAEPPGQAA